MGRGVIKSETLIKPEKIEVETVEKAEPETEEEVKADTSTDTPTPVESPSPGKKPIKKISKRIPEGKRGTDLEKEKPDQAKKEKHDQAKKEKANDDLKKAVEEAKMTTRPRRDSTSSLAAAMQVKAQKDDIDVKPTKPANL